MVRRSGCKYPATGYQKQKRQSWHNKAALRSIIYKVLTMRGYSPKCGEGGVYSAPVKCGNRNSSEPPM
ncbi:hypothetical protein MTO96_024780 [Rhipicephalus appendiculatus]